MAVNHQSPDGIYRPCSNPTKCKFGTAAEDHVNDKEAQQRNEQVMAEKHAGADTIASNTSQNTIEGVIDPSKLTQRSYAKYGFKKPTVALRSQENAGTINYDKAVKDTTYYGTDLYEYTNPNEPAELTQYCGEDGEEILRYANNVETRMNHTYNVANRVSDNQRITYSGMTPLGYIGTEYEKNYEKAVRARVGEKIIMSGVMDATMKPAQEFKNAEEYSYHGSPVVLEMRSVDGGDIVKNGDEIVMTRPNQSYIVVGRHELPPTRKDDKPTIVLQMVAVTQDNKVLTPDSAKRFPDVEQRTVFTVDGEPFYPEAPEEHPNADKYGWSYNPFEDRYDEERYYARDDY